MGDCRGICASRDEKLVYARINANSQEREFAKRSGGEKRGGFKEAFKN